MAPPVDSSSSSPAPTKGPLLQLVALGLLLVALVFAIVAAATQGWIYVQDTHIGLFQTCAGSPKVCVSTLTVFDSLPDSKQCKAQDSAAQAFIILSILFIFPLFVLVFLRRFLGTFQPVADVLALVPWIADLGIAVAASVFLTITWTIVAGMHRKCICDIVPSGFSCALNFSWALAFISWVFVVGTTVIVFLTRGDVVNAVRPVATSSDNAAPAASS